MADHLKLLADTDIPTVRDLPGTHLDPADLGIDVRVTQPDPAWAASARCQGTDIHRELTAEARQYATEHAGWYHPGVTRDDHGWYVPAGGAPRRWPDDVRDARETCMACPVMRQCRGSAIHVNEVSGMAGAWTEEQRDQYRDAHGIDHPNPVEGPTLVDFLVIQRLTEKGWTAQRIAAHLDLPEVTARTVAYARQLAAGSKTRRGAA